MFDSAFQVIARILTWMFIVGMAGCIIVIPWAAVKMFNVLFERDDPPEEKAGKTT